MLKGMRPQSRAGRERVDAVGLAVAAVALLLVVAAVAVAFNQENVTRPLPTLTPPRVLSAGELTATQAQLATDDANEHVMAVTLAAVMQVTPGAVALGISAPGTAAAQKTCLAWPPPESSAPPKLGPMIEPIRPMPRAHPTPVERIAVG